jgi:hypothetical protein
VYMNWHRLHEPILIGERPSARRATPGCTSAAIMARSFAGCPTPGPGRAPAPRGGVENHRPVEYLIKEYSLEQGALEIQYLEEFFGEFPRKKTAAEIIARLRDREHSILMAEARLPDDPGTIVPVAFKVGHEIRAHEGEPKLADLVSRLDGAVRFAGRKVLYSWIGGTRRDWRAQGHFRALTEEQEAWALAAGFDEVVVKTKNRFYEMRGTLGSLQFDVVKYERHPADNRESKVYLSKRLSSDVIAGHRSMRTVVRADG